MKVELFYYFEISWNDFIQTNFMTLFV